MYIFSACVKSVYVFLTPELYKALKILYRFFHRQLTDFKCMCMYRKAVFAVVICESDLITIFWKCSCLLEAD